MRRRVFFVPPRVLLSRSSRRGQLYGGRGHQESDQNGPRDLQARHILLRRHCESMPQGTVWVLIRAVCAHLYRLVPPGLLLPRGHLRPLPLPRGAVLGRRVVAVLLVPGVPNHPPALQGLQGLLLQGLEGMLGGWAKGAIFCMCDLFVLLCIYIHSIEFMYQV